MAKKHIKTILKTKEIVEEKDINAIVTDDTYLFSDNGIKVTLKINNKEVTLIRENDTYQLKLNFKENKKTNGIYLLKETNTSLNLEILTKKLKVTNKKITIIYILNDELREYELNIEE